MSRETLELVRQYYGAWNGGDIGGVMAAFADDVEWHGHPRLPEPGPYRSRAEVERWMEQFREAWGELVAEPVELIDADDSVIALVRMSGRGRGSGLEVRGGVDVHVIGFSEGAVSYFRIYPGEFLIEQVGLSDREVEAVILRVQQGLEIPAIADRLGISEAEAEETLARVREAVKRLPRMENLS